MQKVILPFLVAFILLMVVIILSRLSYNNTQGYSHEADSSRNIIQLYNNVDVQLRSAEIYSPTYENTEARELYRLYKDDLNTIELSVKQLKFYIRNKKEQAALADTLEKIIQRQLPILRLKNMAEFIASEHSSSVSDINRAHQLIRKGLKLEEKQLEEQKRRLIEANSQNNLYTLLLAVIAITIVTVTFFQQFFLRKKSLWLEGFLESILDTTQNGIIYYRAIRENGKITDFKIEYANKAVHSLLGAEPSKIVGKRLSQLDSYVLKSEIFSKYREVVEKGQSQQFEHFYQHQDVTKWLYISITKLGDGITVAFHNIDDIKQYEEELKKNIAVLKSTNQELEEYAYAASHDLQEPLRKIRTFGGILNDTQKERLDERGKLQVEKILQSTERMSLLIKDLLTYSSLKQKDEFIPTDLTSILENVLQDLEILIEQKKAIISHDPLPEINAIPVQINQLFYNLINNSLKFSKDNFPLRIDISCKKVKSEDVSDVPGLQRNTEYYEIIFSDNGIGFNQTYAHQIFGLFKRLNDKSTYAGSGIGLSLCKKVVNNHGGVITANGKDGVGAQFYIYLPVIEIPAPALSQETE